LEIVDTPSVIVPAVELPDDDRLVFAAAWAARATRFLTGDKKHFGRHFEQAGLTGGVRIQTVRAFFSDRFGLKS
jgi:hypothetical protein